MAFFLVLRFLRNWRTVTAIAGISIFAWALPLGLLLAAHVYVRETVSDGVVMAKTLPARELPRDTAKISFEVHSGLKLRLLERSGNFVKVRLPNGLEGWTEQSGVVEI